MKEKEKKINEDPEIYAIKTKEGGINMIDFSPDGESILTLQGHSNHVLTTCYSPDGKILASGSDDNSIRIKPAEERAICLNNVYEHPGRLP